MATTYVIDPFEIATQGITSGDSLTIATQGFIVTIEEEIIIPRVGGSFIPTPQPIKKEKPRKRITVTVTYNNKVYKESKETHDLKVSAKNVKVEIVDSKPKVYFNF